MARRKSGFLDEGSDSGDPSDSDVEVTSRRAPLFVRAGEPPALAASSPPRAAAPRDDESDAHEADTSPISFARRAWGGGLGSSSAAEAADDEPPRRAGLGVTPAPATAGPALSRTSGSGGFDPAAYLRQMGWTGGGLGKEGEGIVNPIEVQLRPNRAGVAFAGRREKTRQERQEERRRAGLPVDSDDEATTQSAPTPAPDVARAWKRRTQKKRSVVYRTYDEIVAEAAGDTAGADNEAEAQERQAVAAALARHAVPTSDSAQLPELRHNLQLLCANHKDALDKLARHAVAMRDKARWLHRDVNTSTLRLAKEQDERVRLASVRDAVRALSQLAPTAQSLADLDPLVQPLLEVPPDVARLCELDEAVAGAMVPVLRRACAAWDPLAEPHSFVSHLRTWLPLLDRATPTTDDERPMTPYESVLWNVWMPSVRAALTNAWEVDDAAPAVALLEGWRPVLPSFIFDNVLEQLVLPKLHRAVQHWQPSSAVPLHVMVLPWLPLAEARCQHLLDDTRRHWRRLLAMWKVADGVPPSLLPWRGVYSSKEWDALLLERVVPKLGQALRADFTVDPAAQRMDVLQHVLAWHGVLRTSVLSRLLESEFGKAWLNVLHAWLTQPDADLAEIAAWYEFWRAWFPADIARLPGMGHLFLTALRHINAGLDRGADRIHLPPPHLEPLSRSERRTSPPPPAGLPPTLDDVTLRQVIEAKATERDLFVQALHQLEPSTGLALLRVSPHLDGKGGVTCYLDDDVIFAAEGGDYVPVPLADLLTRAAASVHSG